jgi:hypothetical protein
MGRFKRGRSVFCHKRVLPFSGKTTMWTFMLEVINVKCESQALLYNYDLMTPPSMTLMDARTHLS